MSKKVFLWYPRRVWKMKGEKTVKTFSWMTWAINYDPAWRLRDWLNGFARKHFLKQRLRKYFPGILPILQHDPNAYRDFEERWPTVEDFIRDQRPICKDVVAVYTRLKLFAMVRRVIPNVIAHDLVNVQPMTGPVGQIFTMRYNYSGNNNETTAQETNQTA